MYSSNLRSFCPRNSGDFVLKNVQIDLGLHLRLEFEVMHEERGMFNIQQYPYIT